MLGAGSKLQWKKKTDHDRWQTYYDMGLREQCLAWYKNDVHMFNGAL